MISDHGCRGSEIVELVSDEIPNKSESLEIVDLGIPRTSFIFRLRNISFLLGVFSTVSLLTLNRLDLFPALNGDWWRREAGVIIIESVRWVIITYLVYSN